MKATLRRILKQHRYSENLMTEDRKLQNEKSFI